MFPHAHTADIVLQFLQTVAQKMSHIYCIQKIKDIVRNSIKEKILLDIWYALMQALLGSQKVDSVYLDAACSVGEMFHPKWLFLVSGWDCEIAISNGSTNWVIQVIKPPKGRPQCWSRVANWIIRLQAQVLLIWWILSCLINYKMT